MKSNATEYETLQNLMTKGRRLRNRQIRTTAKSIYTSVRKLFDLL
jgi:hypothetical protein